jgi:hypothetical protein
LLWLLLVDDVLIMTDPKGKPATDESGQDLHCQTRRRGPRAIAARLTKQLRLALRGKNAAPTEFSGPINYRRSGIEKNGKGKWQN